MRIFLITIQAAALSLFAVLGAQGDTEDLPKCPINAEITDHNCTH